MGAADWSWEQPSGYTHPSHDGAVALTRDEHSLSVTHAVALAGHEPPPTRRRAVTEPVTA